MYRSFYNLRLSPFRIEPDPEFLWLSEKHREGLAALQYGIQENKGFLLLSGDVGTGKTVLVHHLRNNLPDHVKVAIISDPGLDILDLYRVLSSEFAMAGDFEGKADFLIRFRKNLKELEAAQRQVLIIIDEAHRLSREMLDEIRVLSGTETAGGKRINIFLVGQEELKRLLSCDENQAVRQQIAVRYHLSPLDPLETGEYVQHRLKVAGCERALFTTEAIQAVYEFSQGVPRLINSVCDRALLTGYLNERAQIGADIVRECASEQDPTACLPAPIPEPEPAKTADQPDAGLPLPPAAKPPKGLRTVLIAALCIAAALVLAVFGSKVRNPPAPPPAPAPQSLDPDPAPPPIQPDEPAAGNVAPPAAAVEKPPAADILEPASPGLPSASGPRRFLIYFKRGSGDLEDASFSVLSEVSRLLEAEPDSELAVAINSMPAATESGGELFRFRANCIRSFIAGRGLPVQVRIFGRTAAGYPEGMSPPEGAEMSSWAEIRIEPRRGR